MNLNLKEPSFVTILLWTKKMGHYQLQKNIKKTNDWILIIDESIQFGHEKLLVIYGVQSNKIDFTRALNFSDLTPFVISSKSSWTGEMIKSEIEKIKEKTGTILYTIADGGNAISKSLKTSNIPHIYDITHKIALILKEMYSQENEFKNYCNEMNKMRVSLVLSKVAHIVPPNQRFKSRFMNLDIISEWGTKALEYLKKNETESNEYQYLEWVKKYSEIIEELKQVNTTIDLIKTNLKINGLSNKSKKECEKILNNIVIKNQRTKYLKKELKSYFKETRKKVPKLKKISCSSDIIESSFGKYKNYINDNPMIGVTNLALCLSAFTCNLDYNEIKEGIEKTKILNLNKWTKENICKTNLSKRKEILKKVG
jgi:hypothetical protein